MGAEGFVGLDGCDTTGIEVFDGIEPDLERLAAGTPDLLVAGAIISLEQVTLLTGDDLLAVQSDLVEGERESFDAFLEQPLWQTLPVVAAGRVHVTDRLGYPGVAGRIRLVGDLVELLAIG